jgi:hypothetical protein
VTPPAIWLKFLVFVFQGCFKGTAMEGERHHIGGGEGVLGQIGQEEFIDDSGTSESDLPFLFLLRWSRMGRHHDAHQRSTFAQALVWTVVERAADPTFGTSEVLIGGQVQARLDLGTIEELVVFAARDLRHVAHIRHDRPAAILTIQTHQRSLGGKVMGLDIRLDGALRPASLLAIPPVPRVSKRP